MRPGGRDNVTAQKKRKFFQTLSTTGSITRAAKAAGISRQHIYRLKKQTAFSERFDKALDLGTTVLEDEAVRRATEGYLKPIYQQGKKVGQLLFGSVVDYRGRKHIAFANITEEGQARRLVPMSEYEEIARRCDGVLPDPRTEQGKWLRVDADYPSTLGL